MFVVRCSLYASLLSTLIQSMSSIASVAENINVDALMFLFVSVFNLVLSLLGVMLFMQLAKSNALQVSIVVTKKSDKTEDIEMQIVGTEAGESEGTDAVLNPLVVEASATNVVEDSPSIVEAVVAPEEKEPIKPFVYEGPDEQDIGEVDDRGIRFSTSVQYAEKTLEILKEQLARKGENPLEYIPLARIKAELDSIFAAANAGKPYDEARLDYLLTCMDINPDYRKEKAAEDRLWREEMSAFSDESLATIRGFVPPNIFHSSVEGLKTQCGYSVDLAKRLFLKKCLWLTRIPAADIERMHIAELQGRFNPQGQGLDIVELAAIYAAIPVNFGKDHKKEAWRLSLEKQLKDLDKDRKANKLVGAKKRHPAYKNQVGQFVGVNDMHNMQVLGGQDAFKPRESFKQLSGIPQAELGNDSTPSKISEETPAEPRSKSVADREGFSSLAAKINASLLARNK